MKLAKPAPAPVNSSTAQGSASASASAAKRDLPTSSLAAESERAERFGHRFEALGVSPVGAGRIVTAPIQRVIYKDKGKKAHNAFKAIDRADWYKDPSFDDVDRAWAHTLHGETDKHYTLQEAKAEIGRRKADTSLTAPPLPTKATGKRKRTEPVVKRQTGPAVGTQVDYATDPRFRTERRFIRRLKKEGKDPGDKNLYTKRYKGEEGQKPFKILTASIPPTSLPPDFETRDLDELAESRLGQTLHSEGVTEKLENDYPPFKKRKIAQHEHYSASSREQCETCRYDHPPEKPGQHVFGTFYSGTTDHIADEDLRKKLVANRGRIGNLTLTEQQRKETAEAREDAAAARQFDVRQNPLLSRKRKELSAADSEGEHSSDDDDVYVPHELYWGSGRGYGKGKVIPIDRGDFFSNAEKEAEKERTKKAIEERKARGKEEPKNSGSEADSESEEEESED